MCDLLIPLQMPIYINTKKFGAISLHQFPVIYHNFHCLLGSWFTVTTEHVLPRFSESLLALNQFDITSSSLFTFCCNTSIDLSVKKTLLSSADSMKSVLSAI